MMYDVGYTVKYSLSPQEIPRAPPSVFPACSGYISWYIPPLVIIQIQFSAFQISLRSVLVRFFDQPEYLAL